MVALNNATSEQTASIPTYSADTGFAGVFPDGLAAGTTDASRQLEVTVPPLSAVVYKADSAVADADAPGITLSKPPVGSEVTGTIDLAANVGGDAPAQVTFAVRTDGGDWAVAGTDDNAPYSMRYDLSGLAKGTDVELRAIAKTRSGELNADMIAVTVGEVVEPPPATASGADHLIVHYNRPAGDYDDWGLHAWGDIDGHRRLGRPDALHRRGRRSDASRGSRSRRAAATWASSSTTATPRTPTVTASSTRR